MAIAATSGERSQRLDATEASPLRSTLHVVFAGERPTGLSHGLANRLKTPACGEPADGLIAEFVSATSRRF